MRSSHKSKDPYRHREPVGILRSSEGQRTTPKSDTIPDMGAPLRCRYLENFLRRGRECAYVQQRGYRTVRWSYQQVAETAFRFARELERRGIGKGERVLLWGPNSAEWVAVFFGCALRGVIVVPIDDAGTADFAQRVYQQVDGKLLRVLARARPCASIPVLILEDLQETCLPTTSAPYDAVQISADRYARSRFYFRERPPNPKAW